MTKNERRRIRETAKDYQDTMDSLDLATDATMRDYLKNTADAARFNFNLLLALRRHRRDKENARD